MVNLGSHSFVEALKGQKFKLPNLKASLKDWPTGMSPHYDDLERVHHTELKKLVGDGKHYEICKYTNCPFFAASWWPGASWDGLRFGSWAITFLYLWDDYSDNPELSSIISDMAAGEKFREQTLDHARSFLHRPDNDTPAAIEDRISVLKSFNYVGESASVYMSQGLRDHVLDQLQIYVEECGAEQASELSDRAPTIDEYLPRRMGTSAVGFVLACAEYILGIDLGELRDDPDVKRIFDETTCIIAVMNDLFSLKRELRYPFFNNAVVVLYYQYRNLQRAVDETYKIITDSIANLEVAAESALSRYPDSEDLAVWIDGCKNTCTGNVAWSTHIRRYSLGDQPLQDGVEITI